MEEVRFEYSSRQVQVLWNYSTLPLHQDYTGTAIYTTRRGLPLDEYYSVTSLSPLNNHAVYFLITTIKLLRKDCTYCSLHSHTKNVQVHKKIVNIIWSRQD